MWIATQDITGQVIFVWCPEEQIELRKKILGAEVVDAIEVVGGCNGGEKVSTRMRRPIQDTRIYDYRVR